MGVNLGDLLSDENFAALIANTVADEIQSETNERGNAMTTATTTTSVTTTSTLPAHVLAYLQAQGMNAVDIAEIEKRAHTKLGRLPVKYAAVIKEVRKMLKNQSTAPVQQTVATGSQVSVAQLSASLNAATQTVQTQATQTQATQTQATQTQATQTQASSQAAETPAETWDPTPIAMYQLGSSTQLRVNRSSLGRFGFRVFFKKQNDENYQPSKKGFTLAVNQVEHLKTLL